MQKRLKTILTDIKARTGVGVVVYDYLANTVASTLDTDVLPYKNIRLDEYENGVYKDAKTNRTYFIINIGSTQTLTGVIEGVDERAYNNAYMVSIIVENAFRYFTPDATRDDVYRDILLGKNSVSEIKEAKDRYNVDEGDYYVFAIRVDDGLGEVMNFLSSFSTSLSDACIMMSDDVLSYVKLVDFSDVTSIDFATMLRDNILSEISRDVTICVGGVAHGIEGFTSSYLDAISGLNKAKTFGYANKVFSYKEFLLVDVLEKLPRRVADELKKGLLDKNALSILDDQEMTRTADVFLNHSLNLSETARSLYIHRNTLTYRLDKIERDTGLNIRQFSDALIFRILEILYSMDDTRDE